MSRYGENIYKRHDGRYEGRYVIGKTATGKTRFGYIYGHQFTTVRNQLVQKKADQLRNPNDKIAPCTLLLKDLIQHWLENEVTFKIDAIKDYRPAACYRQGAEGSCYTVMIKGQERRLFFEWTNASFASRVARWYVEAAAEAN